MTRIIPALLALAMLIGACTEKTPTAAPATAPKLRIAVVPKGTTHEFWKSVRAGAMRAGAEAGAEITFRGPEKEDDREQQIALVQNLISAKYDAIVLAPLDNRALVEPVRQAAAAKIPIVIIDSGLDATAGTDFVAFVATDNFAGGKLAGEHMASLLGGKGNVLVLRYLEGSQSTTLREDGFIEALKAHAGFTVTDPKRYAGATRATAQEAAENLLSAQTGIDGVFCPNEGSTFGMLLALRSRGLAGKVKFVGFDASDAAMDGLRKGEVHGIVLQNPIRMGYLGVMTALEHLRGAPVETSVDTGAMLVTADNIDSAEAQELISPKFESVPGGNK
ncbi:Ribose import binding protein RbsB [Phycisphaerales bacterium]|nr:Ribose import binding protein RbsB [Phycisphaerales bacterium]